MRRRALGSALVLITLVAGFVTGWAHADQPHIATALAELQAARQELGAAVADKGGHRQRALSLIDEAISEVKTGIDYARRH